jgi:hypothetical protein
VADDNRTPLKGDKKCVELLAPVERSIITGMCIDSDHTRSHEDMLRITMSDNGFLQIDIAAVVPPVKHVNRDKLLNALLYLTENDNRELTPSFFSHEDRERFGFSELSPRNAVVATFMLDPTGNLVYEGLVLSDYAVGSFVSYTDFRNSEEFEQINTCLRTLLQTKPDMREHVDQLIRDQRPKSNDPAFRATLMLTQLFNRSCRDAARSEEVYVPFIRHPSVSRGQTRFLMNDGLARFNASLRDPCALINMANLVSYFAGEKPPFPESELISLIPIKKSLKRYGPVSTY